MLKLFGRSDDSDANIKVQLDPAWLTTCERRSAELKGCRFEDFEVLKTLGTGSFGRVKLVKHKVSGNYYALKMLSKSLCIRTKQSEHIIAERNILTEIKHPFVVNLFATFQDDVTLYFVLEFVIGGEFFTHLRKVSLFPNDTAQFYAASVVLVFEHLHSHNILYRDLKPENLLLDDSGYLKLCDFGFAKHVQPASWTWTLCGTPEYLAPEIILNKGHGKAVDWWALGILLYEMLVGYPPFFSEDRMVLYQNILAGRIEFPRHVSKTARDLISKLLQADLSRRLGNLRGGSADIRKHPFFKGFDWNSLMTRKMTAPIEINTKGPADTSQFDDYGEDEDAELFGKISAVEQKHFKMF